MERGGHATTSTLTYHAGLTPRGEEAIDAQFGELARDEARGEHVTAALRELSLSPDCVRGCAPFQPGLRVRCELARTHAWVLLAILWDQTATPIHDHCESECGFRVIEGEIEETRFRSDGGDQASPVGSRMLLPGDFVSTPGCTVHQLRTKGRAISIHAYAPALCLDDMQLFERA